MNKTISIIIVLIFSTSIFSAADESKNQFFSMAIAGYIEAPENIKSDNNLNFTSFSLKSYRTTQWGQRIGVDFTLLMSSSELIDGENSYLYGGIFTGLLLGQELRIWRITLGLNLILGAGVSLSNLWASPRHIDYFGEINADMGIIIQQDIYISAFAGFQSAGNLFPQFPGTAYVMYYPVWGIAFTW